MIAPKFSLKSFEKIVPVNASSTGFLSLTLFFTTGYCVHMFVVCGSCICLFVFIVKMFKLLSWSGYTWKRDFNLNETFTWLNKGLHVIHTIQH